MPTSEETTTQLLSPLKRWTAVFLASLVLVAVPAPAALTHSRVEAGALAYCTLTAAAPTRKAGRVLAQASLKCDTHVDVRVRAQLRRGSKQAAVVDQSCLNAVTCSALKTVKDPAGNQHWCTRAEAYQGRRFVGQRTRCESSTW